MATVGSRIWALLSRADQGAATGEAPCHDTYFELAHQFDTIDAILEGAESDSTQGQCQAAQLVHDANRKLNDRCQTVAKILAPGMKRN